MRMLGEFPRSQTTKDRVNKYCNKTNSYVITSLEIKSTNIYKSYSYHHFVSTLALISSVVLASL